MAGGEEASSGGEHTEALVGIELARTRWERGYGASGQEVHLYRLGTSASASP